MSHQFKVGDRVRSTVEFAGGVTKGTEGEVTEIRASSWPYEVTWGDKAGWIHSAEELELVAPEPQPTPQLSGSFDLHGFGLQDLLTYVSAFQETGEEKFKIEWTLSGKSQAK